MTTYTRREAHILTADPKLVAVKLKRLRTQGWIIHEVTPGETRTAIVADQPNAPERTAPAIPLDALEAVS